MSELYSDEGVIVDNDGTEALVELPNGELVIRLVKDLQVEAEATRIARETVERVNASTSASLALEQTDVEVLQCAEGHSYTRERTRGAKPKWCPVHKPIAPAPARAEKQTLTCKAGHEWTREPRAGKPPEWCPEHKPEPAKPVEARTERESTRGGKVDPRAQAILGDVTREHLLQNRDEFRLKLWYIVASLGDPSWLAQREQGDINLMLEQQGRLIAEYDRTHKR